MTFHIVGNILWMMQFLQEWVEIVQNKRLVFLDLISISR